MGYLCYYKMLYVLFYDSLLEFVRVIAKYVVFITKCDSYYKLRGLLKKCVGTFM